MNRKWILFGSGGAIGIPVWIMLSHFSSPKGPQQAGGRSLDGAALAVLTVEDRQDFHAAIDASDATDLAAAADVPQTYNFTGDEELGVELIALVERWANRDPAGAARWAARLPEEASSSQVIASVSAIWAQRAPADAAQFVARLPSGAGRDAAIVAVVATWTRHDPTAAAKWIEQFPVEDVRPKPYERLLLAWAESDPLSAVEWSLRLPDSIARDTAVSAFCAAIGERYPAFAFALGQSVSDDTVRRQCLENVARRWLEIDVQAARRALRGSGVEPGISAELLHQNPVAADLPARSQSVPGS